MFKLSNEISFINTFYSGAVQIPQNLVSKPAVRCIMSTSVHINFVDSEIKPPIINIGKLIQSRLKLDNATCERLDELYISP